MLKKTIRQMGRDSIEQFRNREKTPLVLVLDNVRSLSNIGAIFRTADAFACQGIALCGISATPPSPEIHKTALGAEMAVDWKYFSSTAQAIDFFKEKGYTIGCLELVNGSIALQEFQPVSDKKYALVVGNEVDGVDQSVVDNADFCIEIPQSGTKHSLNVSVSAAIAIWEFYKHLYHI